MSYRQYSLSELCSFTFRTTEADESLIEKCTYCLTIPERGQAWVGFGAARTIALDGNRFQITSREGQAQTVAAGDDPIAGIKALADEDKSAFFLLSLDIHRPGAETVLPTLVWLQPQMELRIDQSEKLPFSANDRNEESRVLAEKLNQALSAKGGMLAPPQLPIKGDAPGWVTESDDDFIERISSARQALAGVEGKVIVTRPYRLDLEQTDDPFALYEIYSQLEPDCAASHFARLTDQFISTGCSPENVFGLQHDELHFDVVASTRGVSSDSDKDRRWAAELLSDPKEKKEHLMALKRYQERLSGLCLDDSVVVDRYLDVRQLRHVRHLYSHLHGTTRPDVDFFSLLKGSSPALRTYPEALVPVADDGITPTHFYGGIVGRAEAGFTDADLFLNIRAMLLMDSELHTMGGVGVIAESEPEKELIEVKNKLRCVMESIALWREQ